jgi:hypothetical protein
MQLYVPSLQRLVAEVRRSHSGFLIAYLERLFRELGGANEGLQIETADAIIDQLKGWPDSSVALDLYAPDMEGRTRWALTLDWPVADLAQRIDALLKSPAAQTMFENLRLQPRTSQLFKLSLAGSELASLQGVGDDRAMFCTHQDLQPVPPPVVADDDERSAAPLVTARLQFGGTEQDSGATFLSTFRVVTHVDYSAVVQESGAWWEKFELFWPPISGLGAKVMFDKVEQSFFVPEEAFGAAVFSSMALRGALDGALGFGPQMVMTSPGQMEMMGEAVGPLSAIIKQEACVVVLPGKGVIPTPDIVMQVRLDRDVKAADALRPAIEAINKEFVERDQEAPWHEVTVRDRSVFWRDPAMFAPGAMIPVVMRPVVFQTTERDDRDREREILVTAWTSTSPEGLVRRWLDLPRGEAARHLPSRRKTSGQVWFNSKQLYAHLVPYANVALSAAVRGALLPSAAEVAGQLSDAEATVRLGYQGLSVKCVGPLPAGAVALPVMMSVAVEEGADADSDLARERLACRRLKVLYHHSKLFKKDLGRWPAEITELDGYVDFEGHPQLLRLQVSSKKRWDEWVDDVFGAPDDDDKDPGKDAEDELEDPLAGQRELAEKLYVIEWGREAWRLGYVPGTLEHLERLYIDQEGVIHRVERQEPAAEQKPPPPAVAPPAAPAPAEEQKSVGAVEL